MRREPEKTFQLQRQLTWGLIVIVVLVWLAWWQWDRLGGLFGAAGAQSTLPAPQLTTQDEPAELPSRVAGPSAAEQQWKELIGVPPVWPEDLAVPESCEEVEADLVRVCRALDARDAVSSAAIPGGACALVREITVELASRPPQLDSELTSYAAILSNVFHLFRVLGRDRTVLLTRLVREEGELTEPLAMALYRWLVTRPECARSGQTPVRLEALYDYATFVFRTLGGQAYLRRRDPRTESLASFYALLILDRADKLQYNPLGVDPRPDIDRTRRLLEGSDLIFVDGYLNTLDEMAARWESR